MDRLGPGGIEGVVSKLAAKSLNVFHEHFPCVGLVGPTYPLYEPLRQGNVPVLREQVQKLELFGGQHKRSRTQVGLKRSGVQKQLPSANGDRIRLLPG